MGKHAICHIEWASTDLKRAQAFYGGLFGWKFEAFGSEGTYVTFQAPGGPGGGLMKTKKVQAGASPTVYIQVDDIEPYLKKTKDLGGKVTVPKTQIDANIGWFAHLADPDGNLVGLFQPARK